MTSTERPRPEWRYRPSPDLEQTFAQRLRAFPRRPDMLVYGLRSLAALASRAWLRLYHRLRIEGRHHLPAEASFVMVANHTSHLDTPCLLASMPLRRLHRTFPAAAADYFFSSLPRTALSAVFVNALPFAREAGAGERSLALCRELLAVPGNVLILFPEGTRSPSGQMGRFRTGIARLVAGTDLAVVPCHLAGCAAAWPKGARCPRPRRLRLRIGAPRIYAELDAQAIAKDLEVAVTSLGAPDQPS